MSDYIVSARKYRPQAFNEVVGQEQVTQTLINEINSNKLAQAFLFCGPRGVGKTTCARILAKEINLNDSKEIGDLSFNIFELDAASNNSVEDIRTLIEQVRIPPQVGAYKVYIIDEVHMLSQAAFNAFLKTLEEPPAYAIFILATTEKHKILPTILSRCQIFDFKRIQIKEMVAHLKKICTQEGIDAEDKALHVIAQKADGALRDALSLFDKMVSFSDNRISYDQVIENLNVLDYDYFFKITDLLLIEDSASVLLIFDEVFRKGFEGDSFILGLAEHFRNLLMCKHENTLQLLEVADDVATQYLSQSKKASESFLLNALNLSNKCDVGYKMAKNKRLHVELALLKICFLNTSITQSTITKEHGELKKKQPEVSQPETVTVNKEAKKETSSKNDVLDEKAEQSNGVIPKVEIAKSDVFVEEDQDELSLDALMSIKSGGQVHSKQEKKEQLTQEKVLTLWKEFIDINKTKLNNQFIAAIESVSPLLDKDGRVLVKVDNSITMNMIDLERMHIADFFTNKLKGEVIEFKFEVDKSNRSIKERERPLSKKDLFKKMAEENPALIELQKKLDLDLDY